MAAVTPVRPRALMIAPAFGRGGDRQRTRHAAGPFFGGFGQRRRGRSCSASRGRRRPGHTDLAVSVSRRPCCRAAVRRIYASVAPRQSASTVQTFLCYGRPQHSYSSSAMGGTRRRRYRLFCHRLISFPRPQSTRSARASPISWHRVW
jgi:hypothetical protein